jgi:hypothetical protein
MTACCHHEGVQLLRPLVAGSAALALAGCGGGSSLSGEPSPHAPAGQGASSPRPATPAARVISGWADALRGGDVKRAVSFFAVPSTVQNGGPLLRLGSTGAVRAFNLALPCGARVVRSQRLRGYTLAEFVLTERKGPGGGQCGSGVGGKASTAFLIRDGKIVQWRRIPGLPGRREAPAPTAAPDAPET